MRPKAAPGASILAAILAVSLPGCAGAARSPAATSPAKPAPKVERTAPPPAPAPQAEPRAEADVPEGIFHVVRKGQTLWRIARAYGVTVDELAAANGITDVARLDVDRALFVPRAASVLDVPPAPAPPPDFPHESGNRPQALASGDFEWPVRGGAILSYFDAPRRGHRHAGLDIRGELGQEVVAARAGRVVYSGDKLAGYGKLVILDHGDGMQTLYAHALALLVQVGDFVERGQPIARVGRTGNATTEHCHFEIRKDRLPVDPLPYLSTVARALP